MRIIEQDGSWTIAQAETKELVSATIQAWPRPIVEGEFAEPEEISIVIPGHVRKAIVFGSLGALGAIALSTTAVSLNDMAEGILRATNVAEWKGWALSFIADGVLIGTETFCMFAPERMVPVRETWAMRIGAYLISVAANAWSLSFTATSPWVGVVMGVIMPSIIIGCTYVISYAIHHGGH